MSRERELLNKALAVLLELKDCSDSWCEYYVPIGIHYRIDEAIQELLAQPEQTEKEPVAWMLIDKETGARIPKAYKPEHGVNKDRWELYPLFASPPKQPESTAEAIMPNGVCISNVYAAYEEGRKSVMSEQEPLTNEQKSAEAALEQALRDSIDTEKLMQILKDGGIFIEVGEQKRVSCPIK